MKTILQKHTSKFVAGLFNSLGITACVALTSCGDQDKGKQTGNQVENLKNGLKNVEFYKNLADDEDSLKAIADWLNNKNYGSDHILTENELKEIFQYDSSKLNEVAEKLGVKLTESDPEPNEEKNKEIQKWVTKLNSLKVAGFNGLRGDLKEKVAQKFINNKIDIEKDSDIKAKLADFIKVVKDEKKESEISLKIEGKGKVIITKVADGSMRDFTFGEVEVLGKFVDYLEGKEITGAAVTLSFVFNGENVKICNHESGFDFSGKLVDFFNSFEVLARSENLNLSVTGLSLKVVEGVFNLNEKACSDVYFKETKFWTLVKDYAAFFSITEKQRFEIEKNGGGESATVKINGFESSLKWNEVVGEEDTLKEDSEWNKIFKIKRKEPKSKDVTVKFEEGKYYIDTDQEGVELNSLGALKGLVEALDDKNVKIGGKKNFSLAFDDKNVKVCGHTEGFEVMKKTDFETLLQYVTALKGEGKAIGEDFTIKIEVATNDIKLNDGVVASEFMKTKNFWEAVKAHKELFGSFSEGKIQVTKEGSSNKVKIGTTVLDFEVLGDINGGLVEDWNDVFDVNG